MITKIFQDYGEDIADIHLDTILVIARYSTVCFNNTNFTSYLERSMNMMGVYIEYIKMLYSQSTDDVLVASDALQLILNRFPSGVPANRTCENKDEEFQSEVAMRMIVDIIKKNREHYNKDSSKMNELAKTIYQEIIAKYG